MSSPSSDVRAVPPWLAGLIAMAGWPLGVALLTAVPSALDAPGWAVVGCAVVGAVLGFRASRAVLRRLYTPR